MTAKDMRALTIAVPPWAALTAVLALLPAGTGGWARAVNALLFLTAGPGCAVATLLARRLPAGAVMVVSVATSLVVLLLGSQLLLVLGIWAPWRVASIVALTTIALVVVGIRDRSEI
jgi:hypothetical protein